MSDVEAAAPELDSEARAALDYAASQPQPELLEETLPELRRVDEVSRRLAGDPPPVAEVLEGTYPGAAGPLPYRAYRPEGASETAGPVLLYLHGGGWVIGSIDHADVTCRALARATGFTVVTAAYRLAPEHPFPAGLEDVLAAVAWVVEQADALGVDPGRISLGGESAGGNLAAAAALALRDRGGPGIAHQLLVCPVLAPPEYEAASRRRFFQGYWLTAEEMAFCWSSYLTTREAERDPLASPLLADDLGGLPPATIVVAECDPLADEAAAYAARLVQAGVPVDYLFYSGLIHGFWSAAGFVSRGFDAMEEAGASVRRALTQPGGRRLGDLR